MWKLLHKLKELARRAAGELERQRFPWLLLASALVLNGVGALFIVSAHSAALAVRHLVYGTVGVAVFCALAFFDYRHLRAAIGPLYLAGLLALALLFVFGVEINNARRWYDLGIVHLQPSELMKYVMAAVLADYFAFRRRSDRLRDTLIPLGLTLVPMALIALEPDLGSALLFAPLFACVAFLAGVPLRRLALLALAGVVLLTAAWFMPRFGLRDYQKERIVTFIEGLRPRQEQTETTPNRPDTPASYNIRQVTLALISGGLWGRGWGRGVLNRLGRIPERHTDFIFPVIAEEWGFFRTSLIVLTYLLVAGLMARIMITTRDSLGRLLVAGVLTVFAVQALLHMAISLRLAPITGLTLPLISYGGSSLVSTYAGFGLVASVVMRKSFIFGPEEPG